MIRGWEAFKGITTQGKGTSLRPKPYPKTKMCPPAKQTHTHTELPHQ